MLSTDGSSIVAERADFQASYSVDVWTPGSQEPKKRFRDYFVPSISFDGAKVVAAAVGNKAVVFDAVTGNTLVELTGHRALVRSTAFSQDGRRILTGSEDHTARVWDALTAQQLAQLDGAESMVTWVRLSQAGDVAVTTTDKGVTSVYRVVTDRDVEAAVKADLP